MAKKTPEQIRATLARAAHDLIALRTTGFNQTASKVLAAVTTLDKFIKKQNKGENHGKERAD